MSRVISLSQIAALWCCAVAAAADEPQVAQRWALLIGVDDYAYASDLQYCGADQQALRERLAKAGFPDDHLFLLHDDAEDGKFRPSRGNIERQFDVVLKLADAKDLVVVAFSGHGVHVGGKSFLCPSDAVLEDTATLISLDGIYDQLRECAAPFKLVLVDACRNDPRPGTARSVTAVDGTRQLARSLQQVELPEGVVLLNSCAPGEISWEETKFGHGVFMQFVLEGLDGEADAGGDGAVSLNELSDFVGPKTKAYVAQRFGYTQRPFFRGDLSTAALNYALLPLPPDVVRRRTAAADPNAKAWFGATLSSVSYREVFIENAYDDGPAARAGLQPNDVLLTAAGQKFKGSQGFFAEIEKHRPGETVDVGFSRNGRLHTVAVQLIATPEGGTAERLRVHAEAGDAWAFAPFGDKHLAAGREAEAFTWIRRGAEAGDPYALYRLGLWYRSKEHAEYDPLRAVDCFERAREAAEKAGRRHIVGRAICGLADMYFFGGEVYKDETKAARLYQQAADLGHIGATCMLGYAHENGQGVEKNYAKAFELYKIAAAADDAFAERYLGSLYYDGTGVAKDLAVARTWYERAVEHGDDGSLVRLGNMHYNGEGGPADPDRAVDLFRRAAAGGSALAEYNLGVAYQNGRGAPRDGARAMQHFRAAAEGGYDDGFADVAILYRDGVGGEVNYREAVRWFEKGVAKGNARSAYNLGVLYRDGEGVTQDYAKAMELFLLAAKQDYAKAATGVGAMIYNGQGVQKDIARARDWYEVGARLGDSTAMKNLGGMYRDGEGGPRSVAKAAEWLRKAADLGNEKARQALDDL